MKEPSVQLCIIFASLPKQEPPGGVYPQISRKEVEEIVMRELIDPERNSGHFGFMNPEVGKLLVDAIFHERAYTLRFDSEFSERVGAVNYKIGRLRVERWTKNEVELRWKKAREILNTYPEGV